MLEKLTIENFRGLRRVELHDLARVNIFVGRNASGKTSVMEAASIVANPTSPGWLGLLGIWRELPPPSLHAPDAIGIAFPSMDVSKRISFQFSEGGRKHGLDISAVTDPSSLSRKDAHSYTESSASSSDITDFTRLYGVEYSYCPSGKQTIKTRVELFSEGSTQKREPTVDKLGAFYIHARRSTSPQETASVLTRLFERKLHEPFMQAIRMVDPRVVTMQPGLRGNTPIVLVDIGLSSLIPMNALGDGFCRICLMLTGMVSQKNVIVVVDEIDSGLHHTIMTDFWKSVLRIAEKFEFQLFCSTHNEEMLYSTLPAFSSRQKDLRVFRLDRDKEGSVTARPYDYQRFEEAETAGLDIR